MHAQKAAGLLEGQNFLALFAMPGTSLQCCHGEVIVVLLATGYLGEHQTAWPGAMNNRPGAIHCLCIASPALSFHSLTPSSTPPPLWEAACIHSCAQRHYRKSSAWGREVSMAFFYFRPSKAWQPWAVMPIPFNLQLKWEHLAEEKPLSTYFTKHLSGIIKTNYVRYKSSNDQRLYQKVKWSPKLVNLQIW